MDDSKTRKGVRSQRDQLLTLVNGWDPAGLLQAGGRRDSYFGLIDGLLAQLSGGATKEEVSGWIGREINQHFGVAPADTDAFARRAFAWFELSSKEQSS